jgi:hypothetical protein
MNLGREAGMLEGYEVAAFQLPRILPSILRALSSVYRLVAIVVIKVIFHIHS